MLAALDKEQYVHVDSMTFDDLCDRYLEAKARTIELTSVRWYERNLRAHVRPLIGSLKISRIKPLHIQSVIDQAIDTSRSISRRGKSLSAPSRKNLLICIRAVFSWAIKMEIARKNPATNIDAPKINPREYPEFNRSTIDLLLVAVENTEFETIIPFAFLTGARRGEIAALRWQDIDFRLGRFHIRRSAAILDGDQIYKSPKSRKSIRTEALPTYLIVLLQKHETAQKNRYSELGIAPPNGDTIVFDREDGQPWNVNELSRRWTRFVIRARLPHLRFHDLRHGFVSTSHDAGESLQSISLALGHSSIGITASTYLHVFDAGKRLRANRLNDYVFPDSVTNK